MQIIPKRHHRPSSLETIMYISCSDAHKRLPHRPSNYDISDRYVLFSDHFFPLLFKFFPSFLFFLSFPSPLISISLRIIRLGGICERREGRKKHERIYSSTSRTCEKNLNQDDKYFRSRVIRERRKIKETWKLKDKGSEGIDPFTVVSERRNLKGI